MDDLLSSLKASVKPPPADDDHIPSLISEPPKISGKADIKKGIKQEDFDSDEDDGPPMLDR